MVRSSKRQVLPGSKREKVPNSQEISAVTAADRIEVTVLIRPSTLAAGADAHKQDAMSLSAQLPENREYISREDFASQRGADPADFAKIEQFAADHNLTVTMTSPSQRIIKLAGSLADLSKAFGAKVEEYKLGDVRFRGRTGSLSVPQDLTDLIVGVYGFDTRPSAQPHFRWLKGTGTRNLKSVSQTAPSPKAAVASDAVAISINPKPFAVADVARLYNFPPGLDGSGQCIGLIELNTPNAQNQLGTGFTTADLTSFFASSGIPQPQVTAVGVSGGANLPNINPNADGEVMLDIEVAGAIAPGAKVAVYFAPNTDKGFIDAVSAAVHDTVRRPSVISISWGSPEDFSTKQLRDGMNQILNDATLMGITVCCASGDNGSADQPLQDELGNLVRDGKPHVDFPASSPFALACGGTTLIGSGSTIQSEVAWNEGDPQGNRKPSGSSGGGVSNLFARPVYQAGVRVPRSPKGKIGRGVPDVAGNADSASGYLCKVAQINQLIPIGGTSAVAPLWAGLVALINQRLASLGKKTAGSINSILYNSPTAFQDITVGSNDIDGSLHKYAASAGWDPCTGLGSPNGVNIMKALGG